MAKNKRPRRSGVIHAPRQVEIAYRAEMIRLSRDLAKETRIQLIGALPELFAMRAMLTLRPERADNWDFAVERIIESLTVFGRRRAAQAMRNLGRWGEQISDFNKRAFSSAMANLIGVDMFRGMDGPWLQVEMRSWVAENTRLITSIPDQMLTQVEGIVQRALREGADPRRTAAEIRERFGVTESRAKMIARDQVAKLNSDITQSRNQALGLDTYIWSTSGDERVRDTHTAMNGKLCKWDDPTVYSDDDGQTWKPRSAIGGVEEHPGKDYQCRCVSMSVVPAEFLQ
jgi:SPP1 gp7 family putative phage head morphogenesis protein